MSTPKKEIEYVQSTDTRIALVEQSYISITSLLKEIKEEIKSNRDLLRQFRIENQQEFNKIWSKVEFLDQRINDNFKWVMGIMVTLFSGLYATALGGMLLRLCKWI